MSGNALKAICLALRLVLQLYEAYMSRQTVQTISQKCRYLTVAVLFNSAAHPVWAATIDLPNSLPNMVGAGVGSTTDYAGDKDRMVGVVPGLRYVISGGHLLECTGLTRNSILAP